MDGSENATLADGVGNGSAVDYNATIGTTEEEDVSGLLSPYVQALMYVMYTSITVAAVGGNGIVCYIVLAFQKMRSVTNFFIVNLAVGDILMAILCIPFTFVANLILMHWPFGTFMCPLVSYAQCVCVFLSAYTMCAISIDRYIAIIYPLRPRMTKLQAKFAIALVWLVAIVTPLPTAIFSRLYRPPEWRTKDKFVCMEVWESQDQHYHYSMALTILQYVLPLFALIFTYARIALVVWGKRAPGEAEDARDQKLAANKRKMIKMMVTCVTSFTLSWLPLNVLILFGGLFPEIYDNDKMPFIWFGFHFLAMSHTCYNPFIYCWMNSKYRQGFRHVLGLRRTHSRSDFLTSHSTIVFSHHQRDDKMVKMMITVVVIFTICWLPFNLLVIVGSKNASIWHLPFMAYVWATCHWLAMSHACYNPIIYMWMNARFREGFRHVFRHVPLVRAFVAKKRKNDESLKRCNTYTTSYTSVRTNPNQSVKVMIGGVAQVRCSNNRDNANVEPPGGDISGNGQVVLTDDEEMEGSPKEMALLTKNEHFQLCYIPMSRNPEDETPI